MCHNHVIEPNNNQTYLLSVKYTIIIIIIAVRAQHHFSGPLLGLLFLLFLVYIHKLPLLGRRLLLGRSDLGGGGGSGGGGGGGVVVARRDDGHVVGIGLFFGLFY